MHAHTHYTHTHSLPLSLSLSLPLSPTHTHNQIRTLMPPPEQTTAGAVGNSPPPPPVAATPHPPHTPTPTAAPPHCCVGGAHPRATKNCDAEVSRPRTRERRQPCPLYLHCCGGRARLCLSRHFPLTPCFDRWRGHALCKRRRVIPNLGRGCVRSIARSVLCAPGRCDVCC